MNNIKKLVEKVELESKKAQRAYDLAKESAQEIAKTALTSHSQAGDRFHSQGAMEIAKEKLSNVEKLKKELETIDLNRKLEFIEAPCFIKTDKNDFFLVKNTILLSGITLVSVESEIGKELINKQVGDVVNGLKIIELE